MNVVSGAARDGCLHFGAGRLPLRNGALGAGEAMFRPEDLRLAEAPEGADFSGRVLVCLFQGDHTRLEIDVGAARSVVARIDQRHSFAPGTALAFALNTPALFTAHHLAQELDPHVAGPDHRLAHQT